MATTIKGTGTSTFGGNVDVPQIITDAPCFSAKLSTNQNFTAATWTKVQFDTEEWDLTGDYDNSTNYRFTPSVAGYYQINTNCRINYSSTAGNWTLVTVYKNGSNTGIDMFTANVTGQWGSRATGGLVYCNGTTDYIEIYVWSDHTSPFLQTTNNTTRFSGVLVRAV